MEEMVHLFQISRRVTEEDANKSPYLYASYKYGLSHIRLLTSGELAVKYKLKNLPNHVINFISEHETVIVIANIVSRYVVQVILRGFKEKGFTVFSPSIVPFYGFGRMSPSFRYGDPIVLVEGVLDQESVRLLYPNTLSILTASLSHYQLSILENLTSSVVLCLDNDKPGVEGSAKAKYKLRGKGIHVETITLPPFMKDPGNLIEYDMSGKSYEYLTAKSFLETQILTKTISPK